MNRIEEENCIPGHYHALGVDMDFEQRSFVMTVIDANRLRVVHWSIIKDASYWQGFHEVLRLANKYAGTVVVSRASSHELVAQELLNDLYERGLPCYGYRWNKPNEAVAMGLLLKAIEHRGIDIPGYAYGERRVPFDEMVISLALAYLEASKPFEPANEEKIKQP